MPKVVVTRAKGLHQVTGAGIQVKLEERNEAGPTTILYGKETGADPYSKGSVQLFPLGSEMYYGGRKYRYVLMGGACTAGKLVASSAPVSNHANMTVPNVDAGTFAGKDGVTVAYSHAIGSTNLIFDTSGDTDLTADQYAEGYILINDQEGEGQMLRVRTHQSHEHGVDPTFTVSTYDALTTALVKNSSQGTLIANPYKDVVVAPTTEVCSVIGATVIDMSNDEYGWIVCSGLAAVLTDGTLVAGQIAKRSDNAAGAVEPAGDDVLSSIGQVHIVNADTEYSVIKLMIE